MRQPQDHAGLREADIEESRTTLALSDWVLRNACAQGVEWQDCGVAPLRSAVNETGRQFRSQTFASSIAGTLERTGLDPRWLEIEITERMLMGDIDAAVSALRAIEAMGVQTSIDDFGTGCSSLSYLERPPVDTQKIDQSFVRDVTADGRDGAISRGIVAAIIALARAGGVGAVRLSERHPPPRYGAPTASANGSRRRVPGSRPRSASVR